MSSGLVRRLVLSAALALAADAGQANPLTLEADALRKLAYAAVASGFAEDALRYTDALLQRDPNDSTALVIRSQALRGLGRIDAARDAARSAWDTANTDPGRFGAAMVMAQALATGGRRTAAQWWLRRAAQHAPTDRAEATAKRDFGYVKSRNPWDIQINTSATPRSNVNNGSRQDTLTLAGLPFEFIIDPEAQALSGFETGFGLSGTYRFSPKGPLRQTSASFGVLTEQVVLSREAKELAPDLSGTDFFYEAVELGILHKRALDSDGRTALRLGATGGHNWFGGDPLSDYFRLEAGLDRSLGAKSMLGFSAVGDRVLRIDSPIQSSDRLEGNLGYTLTIPNGDQLSVGLMVARTVSDSAEIRNEAVGLSMSWAKAKPVAGIAVQARLGIENQIYEDSAYVAGGREDVRLSANLSMKFENVDYFGFSPVLDVQATRNRSNAALYDTQDFGITLGITSSF